MGCLTDGKDAHHTDKIIVMRRLGASFSKALAMVKKSRDIVNLNPGFQEQLKVWEECQYNIFEKDPQAKSQSSRMREKPAYAAWKKGHGPKIKSDVVNKSANDEPNTAVLSPKTPVQEVEAGGLIDFLDTETG